MPLKILFMGTPKFAVPILKSLSNSSHKILSVYTQPPKKKIKGIKNYRVSYTHFIQTIKIYCKVS